ncbi:hypothetical protein [Hydrogenophaga intermedia]|uniref:hypothetical protein n=2 Tax=Burkholderiales TaxID=80840 RepID=UPI002042E99A|nr:hypothetical protein [Hydrogenophaga intermedia]
MSEAGLQGPMVLDLFVNYFYQRGRLRGAGQFLTNVAVCWCMFGFVGHVITAVPAAMQRRPALTLAEVLPSVTTWWVPEHPISFVLVIGLGLLGFFLSLKGKQLDRFLNA